MSTCSKNVPHSAPQKASTQGTLRRSALATYDDEEEDDEEDDDYDDVGAGWMGDSEEVGAVTGDATTTLRGLLILPVPGPGLFVVPNMPSRGGVIGIYHPQFPGDGVANGE